MRRAARVDKNQPEIVKAFREAGCSVVHLHQVGDGCPDIAVGRNNKTVLVEIKDGNSKLTADEQMFALTWEGAYHIVRIRDDVQRVIDLYLL